ncbi:MAG TPA: hypothetical protein VIV60_26335, partial [Polyangiaceae bacterium]
VAHLSNDSAASLFLSRGGRRFVIVDRNRLNDLRRVANSLKVPLHIVYADHAYARLVSTETSQSQRDIDRPHLVGELPEQATPIAANFDNQVQLRGWRVSSDRVRPGQSVQVTCYFEALGPMDRNWNIQAYAESPIASQPHIDLAHSPAQGTIPTSQWQEGRIVEDTFAVPVPSDFPHESFFIWIGLALGSRRMQPDGGPPNDGNGHVRGPLIFVSPS